VVMSDMKIIAVLPARNEASRIGNVLTGIKRTRAITKIIVVDDASTDDTAAVAKAAGASIIRLKRHGGVGTATRAGLTVALRLKPEAIIFMDADGQHDPRYIPAFLREIDAGAQFVLGRRHLSNYPRTKRFGNFVLRLLARLLCPTGLADPECGYRAISLKAALALDLRAKGYDICMDFIYNAWKNKLRTAQVWIRVPTYYSQKGTKIRTGLANFWWLLKRRLLG